MAFVWPVRDPGGVQGEQQFFLLAVALIPALLFGGLFERLKDPSTAAPESQRRWAPWIVALAFYALHAEMAALRGAILGEATWVDRLLVETAIVGGTAALVISLALPWVRASLRTPDLDAFLDNRPALAAKLTRSKRRLIATMTGAFVLVAAGGVWTLDMTLDTSRLAEVVDRGERELARSGEGSSQALFFEAERRSDRAEDLLLKVARLRLGTPRTRAERRYVRSAIGLYEIRAEREQDLSVTLREQATDAAVRDNERLDALLGE